MSRTLLCKAWVRGISTIVPEQYIYIGDELEFFDNDPALLARNKKILGLGTRHVADERTTNTDLCEAAATALLDKLNVDANDIDTLIAVSTSHDYHYPATACELQGRLHMSEDCTCFDVAGLACSAYVHGLWLGHSLIESGSSKTCLIVCGDITSRHSDRRNRNSNMLFGDAGTATLLKFTEKERPAWFLTGTRGKDWDKLIAPAGGYALPIEPDIAGLEITDDTGNVWRMCDDIMKGLNVFKFSTEVGPKGLADLLEFAGKTKEEIDYFAFHQANKQIVRSVASYADIPKDKFSYETFTQYGNCGSAAVVVDLCRQLSATPAKNVCLATFGVGFSWGFCMLDLSETIVMPIGLYKIPEGKMNRQDRIDYWINYYKAGNSAKK